MEEGTELLHKLAHREENTFPMFTSCCPGWVRYVKAVRPELTDQLSTAKSPGQMFGAVTKSYYRRAQWESIRTRSSASAIMPCTAKKHEVAIPVMNDACGDPDVDVVPHHARG